MRISSKSAAIASFVMLSVLGGASTTALAAPGRDAGARRALIGKTYDANGTPAALRGWENVGGALVSDESDERELVVTHFRKGRANVLTFEAYARDTATAKILDVIEIKSMPTREQALIGICTYRDEEAPYHVAIAKENPTAAKMLVRRVWYVDRARLQFSRVSTAGFNCDQEQS